MTEADDQVQLDDVWLEEFAVTYSANPPPETRIDECIAPGVPSWLCGVREGLIFEAYEGAEGLLIFAWGGLVELKNLGVMMAAHNIWAMKTMGNAMLGDENAKAALIQELYVEYRTLV